MRKKGKKEGESEDENSVVTGSRKDSQYAFFFF